MDQVDSMSLKIAICIVLIALQVSVTNSDTNADDVTALTSLKENWENAPPSWNGFLDPCGNHWEGITCNNSRIISITLSSMGLKGNLSGDIQGLSELQILDLSYNNGLTGSLPEAIGTLLKLTNLYLVDCNFIGQIPGSIGSLSKLKFLSLNSNSFSGQIPSSIGSLSELYWLDLAENKLTGTLPISNGTTPGLDLLHNCKHFHFGRNQLSGSIPPQLFHENMTLIHLLLDNNQFTGSIPSTIGLVKTMEVLRLDGNVFQGSIPSNISSLANVTDMLLSNNQFDGTMPDLTGMNLLSYLDMSNNSFDASEIPSWFTTLTSLTTLMMENTQLEGEVPIALFSLPLLQEVVLKRNKLSGTLNIGTTHSSQLRLVDLQNNNISSYTTGPANDNIEVILIENRYCSEDSALKECIPPGQTNASYSTPQNCASDACDSNKVSSPNCNCAYPYTGTLVFRAPKFSNLENITYYKALEIKLMNTFNSKNAPVDSVSLSNISRSPSNYLYISLKVFPLSQDRFNRTAISAIGFIFSNQTFKPPPDFGPYYFTANDYTNFAAEVPAMIQNKKLSLAVIIGIAVGGFAFLLILLCGGACLFFHKKKSTKEVKPANSLGFASASSWMSPGLGSSATTLPLAGSRVFSFEEIKKMTNNFTDANVIGSGTYGKVYRGTHTNGQLVAIKRAEQGSSQGDLEFQTEVELLSRVHHKNLVRLFGFCLEAGELILVYEYVPNGTLNESLSGKSGIRLDWRRRLKVSVGAARGLAYLHELANPPVIHRDIKSNNILLDENLNAKVSDFGLSKPLIDVGKGHITTEVKGTMGYLDPEYYMTQKLNEKSDVYSFGVLMLELITGKPPIFRGRYIVREVRNAIDRNEDLYGLHEFLDPGIGLGTTLKAFEKYVDLALSCVEESGVDRPFMGEVVKQLEDILQMAGLNPYSDSAASSATFSHRNSQHLYGDESLYSHSGQFPR